MIFRCSNLEILVSYWCSIVLIIMKVSKYLLITLKIYKLIRYILSLLIWSFGPVPHKNYFCILYKDGKMDRTRRVDPHNPHFLVGWVDIFNLQKKFDPHNLPRITRGLKWGRAGLTRGSPSFFFYFIELNIWYNIYSWFFSYVVVFTYKFELQFLLGDSSYSICTMQHGISYTIHMYIHNPTHALIIVESMYARAKKHSSEL